VHVGISCPGQGIVVFWAWLAPFCLDRSRKKGRGFDTLWTPLPIFSDHKRANKQHKMKHKQHKMNHKRANKQHKMKHSPAGRRAVQPLDLCG